MKRRHAHILYYFCLFSVLIVSSIGAYKLSGNRQAQFYLLLFMSFFYAFWGILHHMLHHTISTKIVVEYILISLLGVAAVLFFLKGALGV